MEYSLKNMIISGQQLRGGRVLRKAIKRDRTGNERDLCLESNAQGFGVLSILETTFFVNTSMGLSFMSRKFRDDRRSS